MLGAGFTAAMMTPPASAQSVIIKKPIPHSGEMLPVVGLGTANSFGRADRDDTRKVIETLVVGGGSLIDTASTYGAAEEVIGEAVANGKLHGRVFLATKMEGEDAREGQPEFDASLRKLRVRQVDLMMLHNVTNAHQSLAYLREWKARKLTRSLLPAKKLDRVIDAVNRLEKLPDVSILGALLRSTQ